MPEPVPPPTTDDRARDLVADYAWLVTHDASLDIARAAIRRAVAAEATLAVTPLTSAEGRKTLALLVECREALRPFAAWAAQTPFGDVCPLRADPIGRSYLATVSDLRRAAAVLAKLEAP